MLCALTSAKARILKWKVYNVVGDVFIGIFYFNLKAVEAAAQEGRQTSQDVRGKS